MFAVPQPKSSTTQSPGAATADHSIPSANPTDPLLDEPWQDPLANEFDSLPQPGSVLNPNPQLSKQPAKKPNAKKGAPASNAKIWIIGGVVLGAFLLIGGLTAVAFLVFGKSKPPRIAKSDPARSGAVNTPTGENNTPTNNQPSKSTTNNNSSKTTPANSSSISDVEINQFGKQFEKHLVEGVKSNRFAKLSQMINFNAIRDKAIQDLEVDDKVRQKAVFHIQAYTMGGNGIVSDMEIEKVRSYQFVGARQFEGKPIALFRRMTDDTFAYEEFVLGKDKNGNVKAVDYFQYWGGWLSLRHAIGLNYAARDEGFKLKYKDGTLAEKYRKNIKLFEEFERADKKKRLELYRQFPEAIQKDHGVFVRMWNASQKFDTAIRPAYDLAQRYYGNHRFGKWLVLNFSYHQDNVANAIKIVDEMDQAIGGDFYMDVLRADVYMKFAKYDEAIKAMTRAEKYDLPDYEGVHFVKAACLVAQRDHTGTIAYIRRVDPQRKYGWRKYFQQPFFSHFKNSRAYLEWEGGR